MKSAGEEAGGGGEGKVPKSRERRLGGDGVVGGVSQWEQSGDAVG